MSHNASTAVVCEIKYSGKPGKKRVVVHFERGKETKTEELDLMTAEGCSRFADCMAGTRMRTVSEPTRHSHFSCVRAEIYWPVEFLKVIVERLHSAGYTCVYTCIYVTELHLS